MSQTDYQAAVAEFLRTKSVTRCPTACVAPTHTAIADTDRNALRGYSAAREAARMERLHNYQQADGRLIAASQKPRLNRTGGQASGRNS